MAVDVSELFAKVRFGGDPQPLLLQPLTIADQRRDPLLTGREAVVRRHTADFGFNGIELGDPAQTLGRDFGSIAVKYFRQLSSGWAKQCAAQIGSLNAAKQFVHLFLARLCTFLWSSPEPEDALVRYELERLADGQDDAADVINILPFVPV